MYIKCHCQNFFRAINLSMDLKIDFREKSIDFSAARTKKRKMGFVIVSSPRTWNWLLASDQIEMDRICWGVFWLLWSRDFDKWIMKIQFLEVKRAGQWSRTERVRWYLFLFSDSDMFGRVFRLSTTSYGTFICQGFTGAISHSVMSLWNISWKKCTQRMSCFLN